MKKQTPEQAAPLGRVKAAKAAERLAKRQAKEKAAADHAAERERLRDECRAAGRRVPEQFSDWGYVKAKTWAFFAGRCVRAANLKRPGHAKLRGAIESLESAIKAGPDECMRLLALHNGKI